MIITIQNGISTVDKLKSQRAQILLENLSLRRQMEHFGYDTQKYIETIMYNEQSLDIIDEMIQAIQN